MEEQPRKTEVVVGKLFQEMESTVTAYDHGVISITTARNQIGAGGSVNGTSFFPVGCGLWCEEEAGRKAPVYFPLSPIMILGHNWGAVHELVDVYEHESDPLDVRTWKYLRLYLEEAKVEPTRCFFTNVLVGLQPDQAFGGMRAGREFPKQCRAFLCKQIEIVKPCLVVLLGRESADQYRMSRCTFPSLQLLHPSYVARHFPVPMRPAIVADEAAKLSSKVNALPE